MGQNLGEGAAVGGFGDIPFGDWHAKGRAKIGSTSPYTAQSPDDQRAGGMCFGQGGLFRA